MSKAIPFRVYGDGAEAQQKFELLSMLPLMSASHATLDSRILLTVRNCEKTHAQARTDILEVVRWSIEALRIPASIQQVFYGTV